MSKDPAFLFYPGDYLKDTQCLSEKAQVAYDRLLCEHMRNICVDISLIYVPHETHTFFTKNLTDEEKKMLNLVLTKLEEGVQIEWVARSMAERKAYTESRSKNRASKPTKKPKDISSTYVSHMVNEDVNDIVIKEEEVKEGVETIRNLTEESEQVLQALMEKFGITEMNDYPIFTKLHSFVSVLQSRNEIGKLIKQAKAYWIYKEKSGDKTHGPLTFIGTIEKKYQDGGWCADNWEHKLNNFKDNGKQATDYGKLKTDSAERMAAIIRDKHGSGNQQPD